MTKTAARSYQEFWDNQDATPRVLLHRAAYKWAIHTGAYKKVSENLDDPCAAILQAYLSSGDS